MQSFERRVHHTYLIHHDQAPIELQFPNPSQTLQDIHPRFEMTIAIAVILVVRGTATSPPNRYARAPQRSETPPGQG